MCNQTAKWQLFPFYTCSRFGVDFSIQIQPCSAAVIKKCFVSPAWKPPAKGARVSCQYRDKQVAWWQNLCSCRTATGVGAAKLSSSSIASTERCMVVWGLDRLSPARSYLLGASMLVLDRWCGTSWAVVKGEMCLWRSAQGDRCWSVLQLSRSQHRGKMTSERPPQLLFCTTLQWVFWFFLPGVSAVKSVLQALQVSGSFSWVCI